MIPPQGLVITYGTRLSIQEIAADATLNSDVGKVDATAGAIAVTIPDAALNPNKVKYIKKTDSSANNVTLTPTGGDTIDGQTSIVYNTQGACLMLVSDGTNWIVIGSFTGGFV